MGLKKWLHVEGPVDDATIAAIEQLFHVTFPQDYKNCIKQFNGGYPEPSSFDYDNGAQGIFHDLISFTNNDLNISMFQEFAVKSIVPFGRDPFGNLLAFDYRLNKEKPPVILFDHEEIEAEAITPVCNTFTELLDKLYSIES
ncbi:SMI1/KNR4 family protein [Paenibacillus paeoniae]|uniref:SMI1/KNR4 family protein n=1 Tax=Paenibacillus paeoniae TaxID=2292705 RepID=A0A371PLK2_9BACL|nr:SMI1/KNR4 family protein [Paenibacillus paeoniae]REK76865.1 SMI1/KNR4 family protein [Paenibacillus paeoniae]